MIENTQSSPYFSVESDIALYHNLIQRYGREKARGIGLNIFAGNFRSQNWEATKATTAYQFSYFLSEDGQSLVHDCDLYGGRDILEGVSKNLRGGLEFDQVDLVRKNLIASENGTSTVWVSPRKTNDLVDQDCIYTHTFINIAERVSDREFQVRQFQTDKLNLSQSALLLNLLSGEDVVEHEPDLAEVMHNLGNRFGKIEDREVGALIGKLTNSETEETEDLTAQATESALKAGRKYFAAIEQGIRGEELEELHINLLKDTIDMKTFKTLFPTGVFSAITSCGIISSKVNVPSWCNYNEVTGEISCRLCGSKLSLSGVKNHRCKC